MEKRINKIPLIIAIVQIKLLQDLVYNIYEKTIKLSNLKNELLFSDAEFCCRNSDIKFNRENGGTRFFFTV